MPNLPPIACALALLPLTVDTALAQVPPDHAVFGTFTEPGSTGNPPGLFVTPLDGGPSTPITGLPVELSAGGAFFQGTFGISLRSSDGALLVTTLANQASPTQGDVHLFELHLNGLAVDPTRTKMVTLGTAAGAGIVMSALLPDGRVLVHALDLDIPNNTQQALATGPMANRLWAIVDTKPVTPTITTIPNPPGVTGQPFVTFDVDPTGSYAYYVTTTGDHPAVSDATLLRLDLQNGTECQIASWPGESAWGVACDDDGKVYVSSTDRPNVQHFVHTVEPNGCAQATVTTVASSSPVLAWGLELDRSSGRFIAPSIFNRPGFTGLQLNRISAIDPATGATTVLNQPPAGGYRTMAPDVAVSNPMTTYGVPTDGQNAHWFDNFPNPAGGPFIGNGSYSLTMASAPGSAALSAILLSLGRGSTPVLGAEILVDPATVVSQFLVSGPSVQYPLPLPNDAGLSGVMLNAQSVHVELNGALTTSRGLEVELYTLPAPTIQSVTPSAPLPNTTVTVTGRRFFSGMELMVAGNLTPIASQTATSLTFVMPAGVPCDSSITIENIGGGTAMHGLNGTPVINSMTASGPAAGNSLFVLTGANLDGATVTINGAPLLNVLTNTATGIVGYTPPGTVGPATVVILGATGCMQTGTYTYN